MINVREQLSVALDILELTPEDVQFLEALTYGDLAGGLVEFKKLVKNRRKKLALKYHPDIPNGNEEKMKQINDAADFVMGMKAVRRSGPVKYAYSYSPTGASASFTATFNMVNLDEAFGAFFDD